MPTDVEAFFRRYIESYDSLDARNIADHYTVPSSVVDSHGVQALNSDDQVKAKMTVYCDNMKTLGYQSASCTCVAFRSLGPDACFTDLEWTIATRSESLVYRTGYLLHQQDGVWRINSAVVYGY